MKLLFKPFFILIFTVGIISSCQHDEGVTKGNISFSVSSQNLTSGRVASLNAVLISVTDKNGNSIFDKKQVALYSFGDEYLSEPIALTTGDYKLTEFIVIDGNNNAAYATPIQGSPLAYTVTKPLPINFGISKDQSTKVTPEVIKVDGNSSIDFGYSTFSFNIVNTFQFYVGVLAYSSQADNFELTASHIHITNSDTLGVTLYDKEVDAITNLVTLNDGYANYILTASKSGYSTYKKSFTADELKAYGTTPLAIMLTPLGDTTTLTLQPGAEGKDTEIGNYYDYLDRNFGSITELNAFAWTKNGDITNIRSLIGFDLSTIPSTATILSAKLTLFAYASPVNGSHSPLSGSNAAYLQKVTSAWDENTVTWNTQPTTTDVGQVVLPQSISDTENYTLDVSSMIQDQIKDSSKNFGFMLRLQDETYYRSLVFASSDNTDASKHPKLVITYKQ